MTTQDVTPRQAPARTCPAGCGMQVPVGRLMCDEHWGLTPRVSQHEIVRTYEELREAVGDRPAHPAASREEVRAAEEAYRLAVDRALAALRP